MVLKSLFRRQQSDASEQPKAGGRPAAVPPGVCVYAVGDIHGRADLLAEMQAMIADDAALLTPGTGKILIYVGDYVDRGLDSRKVLDLLVGRRIEDVQTIHLLGNHDAWLLSFLVDAKIGPTWLRYGGDATVHSYGVQVTAASDDPYFYDKLQGQLRSRLPRSHLAFLRSLELSYETGDYLFVHAGVRPTVPLDQQSADDLLWIREPFLSSQRDYGRVVVHGHTVVEAPLVRSNRIGIDTGACWTGRLTCLVLEEGTWRFLQTGGARDDFDD